MSDLQRGILNLAVKIYFESNLTVREALNRAETYYLEKALQGENRRTE